MSERTPRCHAMILAGGVGSRVGADVPKQFIEVGGKPILVHTLELFQGHPDIDEVEVVCIASCMDEMRRLKERFGITKATRIVEGGATYQDSVRAGIEGLRDTCRAGDIVSIHFGASPFVTPEIIADSIYVARKHGNGISSDPVVLCLAEKDAADGDRSSVDGIDRDRYMGLNSPQSFEWSLLDRMYREGDELDIWGSIDPHTTSLMPALGVRLHFSLGSSTNIKITTAEDVDLFRAWLAVRGEAGKGE